MLLSCLQSPIRATHSVLAPLPVQNNYNIIVLFFLNLSPPSPPLHPLPTPFSGVDINSNNAENLLQSKNIIKANDCAKSNVSGRCDGGRQPLLPWQKAN